MTYVDANIFWDNFFLPHKKKSRGGGKEGKLVYRCQRAGCTLLCRLVPVRPLADPPLYKAEVKSKFSKHTHHHAQENEQVLAPVHGPGGKAKGFSALTLSVKQFIGLVVDAPPKITPDGIMLKIVAHPPFANLPFLLRILLGKLTHG
jgi:hypothetical protein